MSVKKPVSGLLKGGLKTALPLLALFIGVSAYLTLKSNRPAPPKSVKREAVQPVRTQEITLASHQPGLRLYGEIKSGRQVELRALVAGKVQKTGPLFREGSLVKKGDLLLSIDPFTYKGAVVEASAKLVEARARLKEIKAQIKAEEDSIKYARQQLKLSKRDLGRAQKLVRRGSVTRQGTDAREIIVSQRGQTLDGKLANLEILRAKAEQQVAGIDSLKWRLQQANRNKRDTDLKAPFTGYIADVNANMGKLLNVNDKVALLLDSQWMDVEFTLSDRQYGRLLESSKSGALGQGKNSSKSAALGQGKDSSKSAAAGQGKKSQTGLIGRTIKVTWKLGDTPLQYKAVVERVAAQISSESGGVKVYARLENPTGPRSIRVGAFVDVDLPDRIYDNVVRLPQTSLYGRSRVYVVGPEQRLLERLVKLRAIDGEFVLVSGDLANGERVVVTRMSTIGAGMKVQDLRQQTEPSKKPMRPNSLSGAQKSSGQTRPAGGQGQKAKKRQRERQGRG